jgi:hypothetical protein
VCDANGQSLAYVSSREKPDDARMAKVLTEDEARPDSLQHRQAWPGLNVACSDCCSVQDHGAGIKVLSFAGLLRSIMGAI